MVWPRWSWAPGLAALALSVLASQAWGQQPQPGAQQPQGSSQAPTLERGPQPAAPLPPELGAPPGIPVAAYPVELLGLLGPQRGGVTFTPSIIVSEEYNDNIFLDNANRDWDFLTRIGPALTLVINKANYQLTLGYATLAELYARHENLSSALGSHTFLGSIFWRATDNLTLSLTDTFVWDRNSGVVAGFATGRQQSWTNTVTPALGWRMTASDTLNLSGSYSVLRFENSGSGLDSDSYGFRASYGHAFSPRFTAGLIYAFTYVDPQVGDSTTTHTPQVGFSYRVTPTLTLAAEGGPGFTNVTGEEKVTPVGAARVTQAFTWGTAGLEYTRGVSVAGGFGGATDTWTVSGSIFLTTLARGLTVVFGPSYSEAESLDSHAAQQIDVNSINVRLAAAYQFSQYVTLFASYTYFRQRTGHSASQQLDVDQNVARVGFQFGYPFRFD